jgi:membrane associated rhomboid family serine protease
MNLIRSREGREPVFNLPPVVSWMIAAFALVHIVRVFLLTPMQDAGVILTFSFIPLRYHADLAGLDFPGGQGAEFWTPVTYAFLHGDFMHLAVNSIWLTAFGSALAWRFGAMRFLAFSGLAAVAGAAAHYLAHSEDLVPVVGASGAISGHMAAVSRFMFQRGGPLRSMRRNPEMFQAPALPLIGVLTDRRVLAFLGIWLGLNLVFGLGGVTVSGEQAAIAWEAHVGGFLFGLIAFSWFDPVRPSQPTDLETTDPTDAPTPLD